MQVLGSHIVDFNHVHTRLNVYQTEAACSATHHALLGHFHLLCSLVWLFMLVASDFDLLRRSSSRQTDIASRRQFRLLLFTQLDAALLRSLLGQRAHVRLTNPEGTLAALDRTVAAQRLFLWADFYERVGFGGLVR